MNKVSIQEKDPSLKKAQTETQEKAEFAEAASPPQLQQYDLEAFCRVVEARRSIRLYDGTPIPEEVVRDCLRLALLAPNSSNLQTWDFYWIRSSEKRQKLIEACLGQPTAKTSAELIVCVARLDTWRNHAKEIAGLLRQKKAPASALAYYEKLIPLVYSVGPCSILAPIKWLIFNINGLFKPSPREPLGRGDLKIWSVKSTALACENLMLAFKAHGFDTCPIEGFDSSRVKKLIGIPSSAQIVMVVSAGKRKAEGVYGERIRLDSKRFIKEL